MAGAVMSLKNYNLISINYFFLFGLCVKAEAAADFASLLDLGSLKILEAALAAFALVDSLRFFTMLLFLINKIESDFQSQFLFNNQT
jgi:hypothetical protein